jgi:hypothetical protein
MNSDVIQVAPAPVSKAKLMTFDHLDGRTLAVRRAKRIARSLQRQLKAKPTIQQTLAIERASCLQVAAEDLRARLLAGHDVSSDRVVRLENVAGRAMRAVQSMLGAKKTPPSLAAYLREAHRGTEE